MQTMAETVVAMNITALLRGRHQTQQDLALWCGYTPAWISNALSGKRPFRVKDFDRIAAFFGLSAHQLLQPGLTIPTERRSGHDRRRQSAIHGASHKALACAAAFVCLFAIGCGGESPTAPSAAPAASYPAMSGTWAGDMTLVGTSLVAGRVSNACAETVIVTGQSGGAFTGSFTLAGNCAQSGTVSGTVSPSGAVTLTHTTLIGGLTGCQRVAGDGVGVGLYSSPTMSVTATERLVCTNPTDTVERTVTVSLRR